MYGKLIIIAFLACFASSYALSQGLGAKIDCLHKARQAQGRVYEKEIRKALEEIRKGLKEGINGGPPLDPLDVTDYPLVAHNNLFDLDSKWTAQSQGLAGFEITQLSLSLIGFNLKFSIKFPKFTAKGAYDLNMTTSADPQKIFGKGTFDTTATDFIIKGTGKVGVKLSGLKVKVEIKKLELDLSLKQFSLLLTGFMNDEELSKNISEELSTKLPTLLQESKAKINAFIVKILPFINDKLAGKSNGVTPAIC